MSDKVKEIILETLGEASALFMSQPIKGMEIVMPSTELIALAEKATKRINDLSFKDQAKGTE